MTYLLAGLGLVLLVLIVVRLWPEPEEAFITFRTDSKIVPPGFAWINSPYPGWERQEDAEARRTHALTNGQEYVVPAGSRGHFVMLDDWRVRCKFPGKDGDRWGTIMVRHGTTTDFASIPRFLHSLLSPLNNTVYGAVLHDYLYRNPSDEYAHSISRAEADRLFYRAMLGCGVWPLTAKVMYLGVRLGGGGAYRRDPPVDAR